jgi:hypothetical protein
MVEELGEKGIGRMRNKEGRLVKCLNHSEIYRFLSALCG